MDIFRKSRHDPSDQLQMAQDWVVRRHWLRNLLVIKQTRPYGTNIRETHETFFLQLLELGTYAVEFDEEPRHSNSKQHQASLEDKRP